MSTPEIAVTQEEPSIEEKFKSVTEPDMSWFAQVLLKDRPEDMMRAAYLSTAAYNMQPQKYDGESIEYEKLKLFRPWGQEMIEGSMLGKEKWSGQNVAAVKETKEIDKDWIKKGDSKDLAALTPYRVIYSMDKFDKANKKGTIEFAFRGTDNKDNMQTDLYISKVTCGGANTWSSLSGSWTPNGGGRGYRKGAAMKPCVDIQDLLSGMCCPCFGYVNDMWGFADWTPAYFVNHGSGAGGFLTSDSPWTHAMSSYAGGFHMAALETVPSVEKFLQEKTGHGSDKKKQWWNMVLCCPQAACTGAFSAFCGTFFGTCCAGAQCCNLLWAGCFSCCTSDEPVIPEEVKKQIKIRVTGHSLGGAMATICALRLALLGWQVELVTFGSPRVGNNAFVNFVKEEVEDNARYVNAGDPVVMYPPVVPPLYYRHVDMPYNIGYALKELAEDAELKEGGGATGLKWRSVDKGLVEDGVELTNDGLSAALKKGKKNKDGVIEFSQAEWDKLGVKDLKDNNFLKIGEDFFQPAGNLEYEMKSSCCGLFKSKKPKVAKGHGMKSYGDNLDVLRKSAMERA